jgi:hypothetical protein
LHTFEGTLEAGWKRVLSGRPKVACLIVEPYPMSAVLIIGASSGIGYDTVRLALKEGHSVGQWRGALFEADVAQTVKKTVPRTLASCV